MADQVLSILILIVEDEALIADIVGEALQEGGYTTDAASGPEQAIAMLDQKHTQYRAVITDVNLGPDRPTGWDVARHARELSPDIPVIYMTGDSAGEWTANGVPNSVLIAKPFAPAQIVTAVSQLLNTGASSPPT